MKKTLAVILSLICIFNIFSLSGINALAGDECQVVYEVTDDEARVVGYTGESSGEEITIESTYKNVPVTTIGSQAFLNARFTRIHLPETIKTIESEAFAYCKKLEEIDFPNSVEAIGEYAFRQCKSLTSVVIPQNVKEMGHHAFYNCYSLYDVRILGEIERIGSSTFAYCDLDFVQLPETLKYIDYHAFYESYNVGLDAVKIPVNVVKIGKEAFDSEVIIYGEKDSAAEAYAVKYGYDFYEQDDTNHYHFARNGYCVGCGKAWDASVKVELTQVVTAPDGISVSWDRIKEAEEYKIYVKEKGSDEWKNVYKTSHNSGINRYIIKNLASNKYYKVGVSIVNGDFESEITGSKNIYYLASPELTFKINTGNITLSWKKVAGATKYNVYRRSGNKTKKIATLDGKTLSYSDKNVVHGEKYHYSVSAVNSKAESVYKNNFDGLVFLKTPEIKSVKNSTSGVFINWKKVNGADGYYIYRKTATGKWKKIGEHYDGDGSKNIAFYVDKTAKSGVKYKYTVRAYTDSHIKSPYESGLWVTYLTAPEITSMEKTTKGISLKWSKTKSADGYQVYRKTAKADKWNVIAEVKGGSVTSYTDKTAKKGVAYNYTVRATKGTAKSGYFPAEKSIKR